MLTEKKEAALREEFRPLIPPHQDLSALPTGSYQLAKGILAVLKSENDAAGTLYQVRGITVDKAGDIHFLTFLSYRNQHT
jgi:hypothetical protein